MKFVCNARRVASTLLLGGSMLSMVIGFPAQAQVAQNDDDRIRPAIGTRVPAGFAELTEQLAPAVVNISTRQLVELPSFNPFAGTPFEDLFGGSNDRPRTREAQSLGSGFIISADGYVVTNNHVIHPPGRSGRVEEITVTLADGSEYVAQVVGRDPASDLAVLKIGRDAPFPFVTFGDSRDVRVGDWVIAIGNPFGLGGTVTSGIVSAVYRNIGMGSPYGRYIQTDASINRGNSGGPMFDMQGRVIGINNAIFSPNGGNVGVGFAIPSEIAAPIVEKLTRGEAIERGYLGVRIQPLTEDFADALGLERNTGAFVQSVEPGRAAAETGIQAGDVIIEVDGREVNRRQTLAYLIATAEPGGRVAIEVIRDGNRKRFDVTLGKRPTEEELNAQALYRAEDRDGGGAAGEGEAKVEAALGLSVQTLTSRIARQIGVPEDTRGLIIDAVAPGSDAAQKGLARGDIVLSASYRTVSTPAELAAAVDEAKREGRDAVLLRVQRPGGPPRFVAIQLS